MAPSKNTSSFFFAHDVQPLAKTSAFSFRGLTSPMDTELKRLRWRCRRGTRELDQLVGWWLDERHLQATPQQQTAFAELLEAQDPDLWDWVMGRSRPGDAAQATIIDAIRSRHQL